MATSDPAPRSQPGLLRRTLDNYRGPILSLWLAGTFVLCFVSYAINRPLYKSYSLIAVSEPAEDLYGVREPDRDSDDFLNTQVNLITSPGVLTAAAHNPKAAVLPRIQSSRDVVQSLESRLHVRVRPRTRLIEVGMLSSDPSEPAVLVNAVVDSFMESNAVMASAEKKTQLQALSEYQKDLKDRSDAVEKRWRALVDKGHADPQVATRNRRSVGADQSDEDDSTRTVSPNIYHEVEHELFAVSIALAEAEAFAQALEAAPVNAEQNPAPAPDSAKLLDQVALRLKANGELAEPASRLKEARDHLQGLTPEDPALREASEKVAALLSEYDKALEEKARSFLGESREDQDRSRELRDARSRARLLKIKHDTLQMRFDQLKIEEERETDEVSLAVVLDERDSLRSMMEAVNKRIEQFQFEAKGEARISVVDQASPPGMPGSDNRLFYCAMVPLFMLPLSFSLFAMIEALSGVLAGRPRHEPSPEV